MLDTARVLEVQALWLLHGDTARNEPAEDVAMMLMVQAVRRGLFGLLERHRERLATATSRIPPSAVVLSTLPKIAADATG